MSILSKQIDKLGLKYPVLSKEKKFVLNAVAKNQKEFAGMDMKQLIVGWTDEELTASTGYLTDANEIYRRHELIMFIVKVILTAGIVYFMMKLIGVSYVTGIVEGRRQGFKHCLDSIEKFTKEHPGDQLIRLYDNGPAIVARYEETCPEGLSTDHLVKS